MSRRTDRSNTHATYCRFCDRIVMPEQTVEWQPDVCSECQNPLSDDPPRMVPWGVDERPAGDGSSDAPGRDPA